MPGGGKPRTLGATKSKATDDPTNSGAPVHIDAALIEAERQVRDLLTEANKIPSDTDAGEASVGRDRSDGRAARQDACRRRV